MITSVLTPRRYFGELNTAEVCLNLQSIWRREVSLTSWPLYRLEMASVTHQIGGWLHVLGEEKNPLSLTGFELRIVQPVA